MVNILGTGKTKEIISTILLLLVLLFLGLYSPQVIGFFAQGFDTQAILDQFGLYADFLVGGAMGIFLSLILQNLVTLRDKQYGDSIFFASQGMFPSIGFFNRFGSFQLFHLSVIIFGFLGLVSSTVRNQAFTEFAQLGQQFTEAASIIFSTLMIPIAENLSWHAILLVVVIFWGLWARTANLGETNFQVITWFIWFIGGALLGVANHLLRYSASDSSLVTVGVFWGIGGLLTVMTGSFIPFWIMHVMNNLFFDLKRLLGGSDAFLTTAIIILVIITILYFVIYRKKLGGDPNR